MGRDGEKDKETSIDGRFRKEFKPYPTISVARCHGRSISTAHDISYDTLWKRGVRHEIRTHKVPVYAGRNHAVSLFMEEQPLDDFLIFLDDDMTFTPDTLQKLVSHGLPVVAGVYVMDKPPFNPLVFRLKSNLVRLDRVHGETGTYDILRPRDWTPGSLIRVDGCGMGCTAIRRDVLEKIKFPWFSFEEGTEDLWFCRLAQKAGYPIFIDTSIEAGHMRDEPIGLAHARMWDEAMLKGMREPPPEKVATIVLRDWVSDGQQEAPAVQTGFIERKWTKDTVPGAFGR